jgi:hypothetical protein
VVFPIDEKDVLAHNYLYARDVSASPASVSAADQALWTMHNATPYMLVYRQRQATIIRPAEPDTGLSYPATFSLAADWPAADGVQRFVMSIEPFRADPVPHSEIPPEIMERLRAAEERKAAARLERERRRNLIDICVFRNRMILPVRAITSCTRIYLAILIHFGLSTVLFFSPSSI